MTWKRVVNRNGLSDGDYSAPPQRHSKRVLTDATEASLASERETKLLRYDHLAKRVEEYEKAFCMLAGDIRRLEQDAVDESGICLSISNRVGVDADVVAIVLKEFMEW
jgi:hypothetical protein